MVARQTVSVIIPNYNGEALLSTNLPQVVAVLSDFTKGQIPAELIIVDDASTDRSRVYLSDLAKNHKSKAVSLQLLFNEQNLGFAKTVNKGVAAAHGDIVYLLNSDVIPEKGFLEPVVRHFSDERVFAVGSMDKSVEDGQTILRGRGIGSWKKGFLMHRRGEVDQSNTLWVSGGSGGFRRSVWEELGGLTELMSPFYWEDIDLSYRALKAGYNLVFEPQSIVVHEHEKGAIKKTVSEERVRTIAYRNQLYFVWLNISDTRLLINHVLWLPVHLAKALLHGDKPFLLGFSSALNHLSAVRKRRRKTQKYRQKTDEAILHSFHS